MASLHLLWKTGGLWVTMASGKLTGLSAKKAHHQRLWNLCTASADMVPGGMRAWHMQGYQEVQTICSPTYTLLAQHWL